MKILLAIDGSACSDAAIEHIQRHSWPEGTEVRVVLVDTPLGKGMLLPTTSWTAYDELVSRERNEAMANLSTRSQSLNRNAPHLTISHVLLEGSPADQIIAEAKRWGADLIVVGSNGRGAVKSLFLGSVSLAVVLHAKCSVLIVRSPAEGDSAS